MGGQTWWYVARASGIVAWLLLLASTVCGLLLATRRIGALSAGWVLGLHRYLGALAIAFTGVHVLAILSDDFVSFGWTDVLLPMTANWHPLAVALGVIAMYLLVAVEVSSIFRPHLSPRTWRGIHLLSYALFGLASIHALTAGTEARDLLSDSVVIVIGACAVFVAALLLVWRSAPRRRTSERSLA